MNKERYSDPTAEIAIGNAMKEMRKKEMLKSCTYCGKIHDKKYMCQEKNTAIKNRQRKANDIENKFRWSAEWKKKAEDIKRRDMYLCQACIRNIAGTSELYNPHDLSVHHIIKLRDDYNKRLDDDNLITLCRAHHEAAESGEIPADELRQIAEEQCKKSE